MRRFLFVLLIGLAAFVQVPMRASAATGPDCTWYHYQPDAQYDLDKVIADYPDLVALYGAMDEDQDQIACEELPERPESVADMQRIRGHFEPEYDYVGIRGSGYSAWYITQLAGVQLASDAPDDAMACADLIDNAGIASLFALPEGTARQYYLQSAMSDDLPDPDADGEFDVTALVWTVFDDPSEPVQLNRWLVSEGLAVVGRSTIRGDDRTALQDAQEEAQEAGRGVWGTCEVPEAAAGDATTTDSTGGTQIAADGFGSQVVQFSIAEPGTYLLTVTVGGGDRFFAADIYSIGGDRIPSLSIVSTVDGTYSAAGQLGAGDHYVQISAADVWSLTIEPLA